MPPQDSDAEQSVLGSMLISKDAIGEVNEVIGGADFYRPAHETIYDAIVDLYGRGEPADPVTVSAELTRRGDLQRVGGAPYLHTLSASVPIAANAGFYARSCARRRSCAGSSTPAPRSPSSGTPARATSTTPSTSRSKRSTRSGRSAPTRTTRPSSR